MEDRERISREEEIEMGEDDMAREMIITRELGAGAKERGQGHRIGTTSLTKDEVNLEREEIETVEEANLGERKEALLGPIGVLTEVVIEATIETRTGVQ
jgi:hypothetical protein